MASRLPFQPKTHTQLDDRVGQRLALYRAKCFFFSLRVLEPRLTMPLGEGRAEKGDQKHGATTLLRRLEEQVRGKGRRGPYHVGAFFIREALLQIKPESLEQDTAMPGTQGGSQDCTLGTWDAGHLQGNSQDGTQGRGHQAASALQPLGPQGQA